MVKYSTIKVTRSEQIATHFERAPVCLRFALAHVTFWITRKIISNVLKGASQTHKENSSWLMAYGWWYGIEAPVFQWNTIHKGHFKNECWSSSFVCANTHTHTQPSCWTANNEHKTHFLDSHYWIFYLCVSNKRTKNC